VSTPISVTCNTETPSALLHIPGFWSSRKSSRPLRFSRLTACTDSCPELASPNPKTSARTWNLARTPRHPTPVLKPNENLGPGARCEHRRQCPFDLEGPVGGGDHCRRRPTWYVAKRNLPLPPPTLTHPNNRSEGHGAHKHCLIFSLDVVRHDGVCLSPPSPTTIAFSQRRLQTLSLEPSPSPSPDIVRLDDISVTSAADHHLLLLKDDAKPASSPPPSTSSGLTASAFLSLLAITPTKCRSLPTPSPTIVCS